MSFPAIALTVYSMYISYKLIIPARVKRPQTVQSSKGRVRGRAPTITGEEKVDEKVVRGKAPTITGEEKVEGKGYESAIAKHMTSGEKEHAS